MSGTLLEIMRRKPAEYEAGRQYAQAVERAFDKADWLVAQGKPDEAEEVADAAAELRWRAHMELRAES